MHINVFSNANIFHGEEFINFFCFFKLSKKNYLFCEKNLGDNLEITEKINFYRHKCKNGSKNTSLLKYKGCPKTP